MLSGDDFAVSTPNKLVAGGTNGQLTIGLDWGNAAGAGETFTVPTQASGVITADALRIVGNAGNDVLHIPDLFLPTTFEGGGGSDSVDATLLQAPSAQTTLTTINVAKITFTSKSSQTNNWVLDTDPSTEPVTLFDQTTPVNVNASFLVSGANRIVDTTDSQNVAFQQLNVTYNFQDSADNVTVLALRHPVALNLGGGTDTVTVGGNRTVGATTVPVDPSNILEPLTIQGGSGTDHFVLFDPRTDTTVAPPVARIDSTSTGAGLIQDYGLPVDNPASPQSITFSGFADATVDLAAIGSIFSVLNTVVPTTITGGAGNDVVNIRKLSAPTTVNLGGGENTLNVQGGGALLTADGGSTGQTSTNPAMPGDRLVLGSTREFDTSVIDVSGTLNAIKLLGNGWDLGQQVLFTTDGTAPTGLTSGQLYYLVPFGPHILRLAKTLAQALAADPSNPNDPNIIPLGSNAIGEQHLSLTINGTPQQIAVGSLTGGDSNSSLSFTQPGAELEISSLNPTTGFVTIAAGTGNPLANGQEVAVFSDGALPGGLESEQYYYVTNINSTKTSFQLSATLGGSPVTITNVPGAYSTGTGGLLLAGTSDFANLAPVGTANFAHFDLLNVLLGPADDTFVMNSTIQKTSVQVVGGPGSNDFVLENVPGESTVISGGSGPNNDVSLLVPGEPTPNQFAGLVLGAGIQQLTVDNSANVNLVNWIVSQGSLYFGTGQANVTSVVTGTSTSAPNTFTFSSTQFAASAPPYGMTPMASGDLVLVSSTGAFPMYQPPAAAGQPLPPAVALDPSQFYVVNEVTSTSFTLSLPGSNAPLDLTSAGTGTLSFQRISAPVNLEGAQGYSLDAGSSKSTLAVVTPLTASVNVTGNQLKIIEGAQVLDETSNLSLDSFSVNSVDGVQGVSSVVTTSNHAVFSAGTTENKIGIFVREVDPTDASTSILTFVSAIDSVTGHVPVDPTVLELSPDQNFLYVLGSSRISVFAISYEDNGNSELQWLQDIFDSGTGGIQSVTPTTPASPPTLLTQSVNFQLTFPDPTDMSFSPDGSSAYVTVAGPNAGDNGIVVLERNVTTGLFTGVVQKLNQTNSFGTAADVGNDPVARPDANAATTDHEVILDQPFNAPIGQYGNYTFYVNAGGGTITPLLLEPVGDIDDPSTLSWVVEYTGTTSTIEHAGVNEFEFGTSFALTPLGGISGLYFGWIQSGDVNGQGVMLSAGTASNCFIQASGSTAWTFEPGYAYSMEASFEANDVVGNNPVAREYADPATVAHQVVLDQPIVGTITGLGTYAFYSDTTTNDIIPELLEPVGNINNPSSLTWKVVAQGKVRTVVQGINRWNLDFPAGTYPSGLYFGWLDTGDSGKGAVMVDHGTASNSFINFGGSSTWTYTPGFAYSMQADFVTEAAGLATPETIAVSSNGNSFVTGDSLGNIATWTKQPQDDGTFQLSTNVGWSLTSTSTLASGGQVSAVNVALADDGTTQVASASPGSTGPNSSIVSANGILFGVNAATSRIQYSFDGGTTWQFATVDGSTSGELPPTAAENTAGFPFANDTFDLDGGAASLASNGSTLLVGVPAGQVDNDSTNYYNGSIPITTISTNNTTQSQGARVGGGARLSNQC